MKSVILLFIGLVSITFFGIAEANAAEKIHFINVGSGDAILLESNGNFALIDGGEDSQKNGVPNAEVGYEQQVKNYIKKIAGNKPVLKFILGTHAHSDHYGGLREVVKDTSFKIEKAYIKEYPSGYFRSDAMDAANLGWDNQWQYDNLKLEVSKRGPGILASQASMNQDIKLGNFTVKFYNTGVSKEKRIDENENSIAATVTAKGKTVLLTGDLNNVHGKETALGNTLRDTGVKVNLFKLAHHGYDKSNSYVFLDRIRPQYAIVTNNWSSVFTDTKNGFFDFKIPTYATGSNGAVTVIDYAKADFGTSALTVSYSWVQRGGYWYYNGSNAQSYKGWVEDPTSKKWYYMRTSVNNQGTGPAGSMVKGWINDNGSWFYLYEGTAASSRLNQHSATSEGQMITGWAYDTKIKAWVYFKQNSLNIADHSEPKSKNYVKGAQYMNGTFLIDGVKRVINSDGYLISAK